MRESAEPIHDREILEPGEWRQHHLVELREVVHGRDEPERSKRRSVRDEHVFRPQRIPKRIESLGESRLCVEDEAPGDQHAGGGALAAWNRIELSP